MRSFVAMMLPCHILSAVLYSSTARLWKRRAAVMRFSHSVSSRRRFWNSGRARISGNLSIEAISVSMRAVRLPSAFSRIPLGVYRGYAARCIAGPCLQAQRPDRAAPGCLRRHRIILAHHRMMRRSTSCELDWRLVSGIYLRADHNADDSCRTDFRTLVIGN